MAENTGTLSAVEEAYFASEGETHFAETSDAEAQAKADEAKAGVLDAEGQAAIDGKDPEDGKGDKGRFVNYGALHQERERRKELETQVNELRDFKAVMADRWNALVMAAKPEPKNEDPEPDPNVDIFAHNAWLKRQLDKVTTGLSERDKAAAEQTKAAEGERLVWDHWNQSASAYKAENPEFEDAVKWMSGERTKQLKAMASVHPQFKTEAGIVQQINGELRDIVIRAAQSGVSPAQVIHSMAKDWGWKAAPIDPAAIVLPDKLKAVDKAQTASRTVGNAAGKSGGDEMSIDTLASMPQKEFNAWMAVPANEATFRKLMGG